MSNRILLVEDDPHIHLGLTEALTSEGYTVTGCRDGGQALALIKQSQPDLVVLDVMLPHKNGYDICRELRAAKNPVPVLMLTAKGQEIDKVVGLELGADDYVTKPFSIEALMARMRALLRRSSTVPVKGQLAFHDIEMDLATHRVTRNERRIPLGPTEFRLLEFFLQHPRRVFTREELLDAVWGPDIHVEPRTVDVHIRRLRKSINGEGELDVVRTVRTAGYALDTEAV